MFYDLSLSPPFFSLPSTYFGRLSINVELNITLLNSYLIFYDINSHHSWTIPLFNKHLKNFMFFIIINCCNHSPYPCTLSGLPAGQVLGIGIASSKWRKIYKHCPVILSKVYANVYLINIYINLHLLLISEVEHLFMLIGNSCLYFDVVPLSFPIGL